MVKPGSLDLELVENSTNRYQITISGITTAVGYSAEIDIRVENNPASLLLLALSSPSDGITLTSDTIKLILTILITEAQIDDIAPQITGNNAAYWSLKVTDPSGDTTQYLRGSITLYRTPTE